mmetsp:Transcript_33758/g.82844  ORF Transcript_33758/g.82844 Transcript_33758/m.82844 type:complete len:243 (+) Transcript_33758:74-802(+)|eukprot:CAMPEP_0197576322 /NCGR_PEP_ID=MMETSP1326-20131121/1379_1 /TAXON_ID=1155430 /ORGANISM="Genus nov. species nov., Strain RCC2288" /LENGTH=242 /DNA_ID=CAMNT_0043139217 /DNA_START=51 /DNA_END=779 /DNA_ORIENTATION=-
MPTLKLDTSTTVTTVPSASFGTCEISTSQTAYGWKFSATAKPVLPELTKDGLSTVNYGVQVNATATSNGVTLFADNVDMIRDKKFAPRVAIKHKATVADQKLDLEVSFAMKGNTATKRTPSEKDVLKFAIGGPAVSGFSPKAEYSTGNDTATMTVSGKVDKAALTLKSEYNLKTSKNALTATVAYPLPEGIKATVEIKDNKSGSVKLAKDRFTLEVPVQSFEKAPDTSKIVLKVKFAKDFDF